MPVYYPLVRISKILEKDDGTYTDPIEVAEIQTDASYPMDLFFSPLATRYTNLDGYQFVNGRRTAAGLEDQWVWSEGETYHIPNVDYGGIVSIHETYDLIRTVQLEITPRFYSEDSDISGIGYYDLYINNNNVPYLSNVTSASTVSLHPGDTYTIKTVTQDGYVCVSPQSGTINGTVSDDSTDNIYVYLIFESSIIPFGTTLNYQDEQVESIENIGYYNLYINNELLYPNQTTPIRVTARAQDTYRLELFAHDGYKVISQSTIEGKCADLNGIDIPLKFVKTVKLVIMVAIDQVMTDTSFSEAVKNYNVKVNGEYYFPEPQTTRKNVILLPGDTYAIEIVANDGYKMITDPSTLVGSYSDNKNGLIYRGPVFKKGIVFGIALDYQGSSLDSLKGIGYYNLYINDIPYCSNQTTPVSLTVISSDTFKIEIFTNDNYKCTQESPIEGDFSGQSGNFVYVLFFENNASGNLVYVKTAAGWKSGVSYVKTANGWKQGVPSTKTENGWK